jgi:hypothetical protein
VTRPPERGSCPFDGFDGELVGLGVADESGVLRGTTGSTDVEAGERSR